MRRFRLGAASGTTEDLSIPIDYEDGGAVDPVAGTVFTSQADVDNYLTRAGATNFKHLQAVWDALPTVINHDITFNCAAGVHRPQAGFTSVRNSSWYFSEKFIGVEAAITVQGADSSTWTPIGGLGGLAVASSQEDGNDPWVQVSGTPFTADELRGSFFRDDTTGSVHVIHKNTTDTIYLLTKLDTTPTAVSIYARPETIFRNSQTDTVDAGQNRVTFFGGDAILWNDVTFDPWNSTSNPTAWWWDGAARSSHTNNRICIDMLEYAIVVGASSGQQNAVVFKPRTSTSFNVNDFSIKTPTFASGNDALNFLGQIGYPESGGFITFIGFYAHGSSLGILGAGRLRFKNTVFDEVAHGSVGLGGIVMTTFAGSENSFIQFNHSNGKVTEFRDITTTLGTATHCIYLPVEAKIDNAANRVIFTNCNCSGIRVGTKSELLAGQWEDGGGNAGYGITLDGRGSSAVLDADVDVTGALGDVSFGGVVETYADIVAEGPLIDMPTLNRIEKA